MNKPKIGTLIQFKLRDGSSNNKNPFNGAFAIIVKYDGDRYWFKYLDNSLQKYGKVYKSGINGYRYMSEDLEDKQDNLFSVKIYE